MRWDSPWGCSEGVNKQGELKKFRSLLHLWKVIPRNCSWFPNFSQISFHESRSELVEYHLSICGDLGHKQSKSSAQKYWKESVSFPFTEAGHNRRVIPWRPFGEIRKKGKRQRKGKEKDKKNENQFKKFKNNLGKSSTSEIYRENYIEIFETRCELHRFLILFC